MNAPRTADALGADEILKGVLDSPEDLVIFALDRAYRYVAFNDNHRREMAAIWGVEVTLGACMLDLIGRADDRARAKANFDRALAGESFTEVEAYGEPPSRRYYRDSYSPIRDAGGAVVGLTVYLTDVTEQRARDAELEAYRARLEHLVDQRTRELEEARARLEQSRRLESLGLMAAGIAHDFNNLLAAILGQADLALLDLAGGLAPRLDVVAGIKASALRAVELTDQMLLYAGKGRVRPGEVDVAELLHELAPTLAAMVPAGVTVSVEAADCRVTADRPQLIQVVTNLVANAAEAYEGAGGEVRVRCGPVELEGAASLTWSSPDLRPGAYVRLSVADDGAGMAPEAFGRVFDPFFSTKPQGRGLGLATVMGVVRAHGGALDVRSAPGRGTCFDVYLPSAAPAPPRRRVRSMEEAPWRAEGRALIVERDPMVRRVTGQLLARLGFEVVDAGSVEEALALEDAGPVRLVLLDARLGAADGGAGARRLRDHLPGAAVLWFSGRGEVDSRAHVEALGLDGWLPKPFDRAHLEAVLRRVLG